MSPDIFNKDRFTVPFSEMDVVANALWLAAGLTIKGTRSLGISRASHKDGNPITFPYLRIVDRKHLEKIMVLSFIYGNDSKDPGIWEVRKENALRLMNLCSSFLAPGKEVMEKSNEDASVEFYKNLLRFNRFPAGIVDLASSFYLKRDGDRLKGIKMTVQTPKKNLLIALQNKYCGSIRLVKKKGQPININGTTNFIKQDMWAWELGHNDVMRLIKDVEKYLLIADETIYSILKE